MRTELIPEIPGAHLVYPDLYPDERGFFCVTSDQDSWQFTGQLSGGYRECTTRSAAGVLRGLHLRTGKGEAKLVRCSRGTIFDVILDLRPDSPARRCWKSFRLTGASLRSLYIPPGCAHGYQALTAADVTYHITGEHDPAEDLVIAWDDPELAIPWPVPVTAISERDKNAVTLAEAEKAGLTAGGPLPDGGSAHRLEPPALPAPGA